MNKVALIYDFDKTLSPKDMQEFHFIPSVGYNNPDDFWKECRALGKEKGMDSILAYMLVMLMKKPNLTKKELQKEGEYVKLYKGVETWFKRINEYGKSKGVVVEHYIISSGIREMIQGTKIAKEFKKIYACSFAYDEKGKAIWPARTVNYTLKTQYLFRINKGVFDVMNDIDLNRSTPEDEKYIPFTNMVYFGDGMTDVPSMKVVKNNGGITIAVYDTKEKKESLASELASDKRANFALKADYSKGSKISKTVEAFIDHIAALNKLEKMN